MSDDSSRIEVEFEHRSGWQQGGVSLPTGLRDRAEIVDGTFTVEFPATESLVSNPAFRRLVDAGHTPVNGVPDDEQQAVQQRLATPDAADDTNEDATGDSGNADGANDDGSDADELDDLERSELYEHAHKLDAVPDDDIPDWNDSTAPGLRELIREYTE